MEPKSILVSQLNVGDTVFLENGDQREIREIGRGFYHDSRLIELRRDKNFQKELRAAHAFAAKWDKLRKLDHTTPGLIIKTAEFYAGQPSEALLESLVCRYENNIDLKRVNEQYLRMQNALLKRILTVTENMNPEAMRGYIEAQIVDVIDEET